MCTMIRTFHPVGQGLFCTERFLKRDGKTINVVYDCGSESLCPGRMDVENSQLKQVLDKSFLLNEDIEAIFISHYDLDHINGIIYLIKHCNVKKIFLPEVTNEECIINLSLNFGEDEDSTVNDDSILLMRAYYNPEVLRERGFKGQVVRVPFNDIDSRGMRSDTQDEPLKKAIGDLGQLVNDALVNRKNYEWRFIPFNNSNIRPDRRRRIREVIADAMNTVFNTFYTEQSKEVEDFINKATTIISGAYNTQTKNILEEINSALKKKLKDKNNPKFKDDFGSSNGSSMVLFSGRGTGYDLYDEVCYCGEWGAIPLWRECSCDVRSHSRRVGCLYCGDYEAKRPHNWNELKCFYDSQCQCWNGIGCVQMPHHGSKGDFNDGFHDLDAIFVACYGVGNKYHHPGFEILEGLRACGRMIYHVTEYSKCVGLISHLWRQRWFPNLPAIVSKCVFCVDHFLHKGVYCSTRL